MILYIDRSEAPDGEHIPPGVLSYCIRKAEQAAARYRRLMDYYLGLHDISKRRPEPEESLVTVNYAKYITDITLGYYLSEGVKYDVNSTATGRGLTDSDAGGGMLAAGGEIDISALQDCYDAQQIGALDLEIGRTMGIMGDCLELCYASSDQDPMPRSARISPDNGILVCDSTVEHRKMFGIVWEKRETTNQEKYYFATVYTERTEQDFRSGDLETAVFSPQGPPRQHFFGSVPVIAYRNNEQRQGDFEQVISLIDAYDQLMSDRLTDKKKFVDAVLVFFGMGLTETDEARLNKEKFVENAPLDARVEYIQKTFDEASVQVLADAVVREIHKQTMTVDMSDENFSGNASGQALKLKLLTMNLLAKGKIAQMRKGLQERFSLYAHWLAVRGRMAEVGVNEVDIVFTLSLPINEAEIVQTVTSLQGIVDDKTLLSQLWFIKDPAEAAENVRRQKLENMAAYQGSFGQPEPEEETEAEDKARRAIGLERDDEQDA